MAIYFPGAGQMTPAQQLVLRQNSGTARASGKKRSKGRKKKVASAARKKKRSVGKKGRTARLVKGSAAAKAWGRKMKAAKKK